MGFDPDKFLAEPEAVTAPVPAKVAFDPDAFLKEEEEKENTNFLSATPGATALSTAGGALIGNRVGKVLDQSKLNAINAPIPPVPGIGPAPLRPATIPSPIIPAAPARPVLQKIGTSTPGVAPGQAWKAGTGYGAGSGYTVQDVVEEQAKQNAPVGKGKLTKNIRGPLSLAGITDQLNLESQERSNAEAVRQKQAQYRAEVQAKNEALLAEYQRQSAEHAAEVARVKGEHAEAVRRQNEAHAKAQQEHFLEKQKHALDVNSRNQSVQEQKLAKQEFKNRPFYKKKSTAGGVLGGLIGFGTSPLAERGYKYFFGNEPEGHAAGGAIQGYANKGAVKLGNTIMGFLEHTPKNPNPLVGTRFQLKDLGGIAPEKPTSLENMRDAMINITPWDATHRNKQILSISGRPLTSEIITHGGTPYARDIEHMRQGIAGASGPAISNRLQTRSNIASQEGTKAGGSGRVIMLPSSMGKFSEDFAVPTFKTYYDFFKQAEHSPEELAKMTNWLRGQKKSDKLFMSDALDLSHPDSYNQLLTGEGLKGSAGDVRKAFIKLQRLKDNQRAMGVNAEDISAAHTIPEIANLERGFAGNTAIEMKPGAKTQPSKNESYGSDFLGDYLGNLGQDTPAHVLLNKPYTSVFNEMKARYPNDPEGKIHQMAIGALERRNEGVSELVNDEMINRVGAYHEAVKQGKINPNDPYGTLQYLKTPGVYAEGGQIEGYAGGKSVSQIPKVAQALEEYLKGVISNAERIKAMNEHLPIRNWSQLPPNYTDEQVRNALMSNKQPKALVDVPAGMQVGNRLDIPAYTQHGVYVDTVHDAAGKPVSYNRTGHLTDVDFSSKPNQAVRVGLGTKEQALTPMGAEIGSGKSPFALMKGTNVGTHDDEVRRMMEEYLKDPRWTQIGMDPRRHSQFYDKSTGLPVWSAEQKLQSGPLVMVPKQGLESTHWEDPRLSLSDFEGKHYDTGGLVALAKKFIPLAERETNKAKAFANRHPDVPDVMYHGTAADINQFTPKQAGATFLSPSAKFAENFGDESESFLAKNLLKKLQLEDEDRFIGLKKAAIRIANKNNTSWGDELETLARNQLPTRANILPVHVNATNPFDYENQKHLDALRTHLAKNPEVRDANKQVNNLMGGNWSEIESPAVQQAIKGMGHDSFWVREGGQKNLGIYDPKQIKSATGNVGTYDTTIPDITKAEGGLMHLKEGGRTEAWTRSEGKNPEGGLNAAGRASYNRAHGAHLKAPQPEGGSRKDSFCARMEGMKSKLTSSETAKDPDSRINKSLRKWKC